MKHYAFLPIDSDVMHYRHFTDNERIFRLIKEKSARLIVLPFYSEEADRKIYVMQLVKKGVANRE